MSVPSKIYPLCNITYEEIYNTYTTLLAFFLEIKNIGSSSGYAPKISKAPKYFAEDFMYMALYGINKRDRFKKANTYSMWYKVPNNFQDRIRVLLGPGLYSLYMDYVDGLNNVYKQEQERVVSHGASSSIIDSLPITKSNKSFGSYEIDPSMIESRMQIYIDDFDLHSSVDKDILRNYVITQLLIEKTHENMLRGGAVKHDLKALTEQLRNYITILGLSKKDRIDLGSERKKGSIAELALIYEDTLANYSDTEEMFLYEELRMLLNKQKRRNADGDPEITRKTFQICSGGFSIEEAEDFVAKYKTKTRK